MIPVLGAAGDGSLVSINPKISAYDLWQICFTPSPHSTKRSLGSSGHDYTYLLPKLSQTSFFFLSLPFLLSLLAQKT